SIAIQPEVTYSLEGAKYPGYGKAKIGVINIPLLGQFMFDHGFRVETGPQIGFLTKVKFEGINGQVTNTKNNFKKIDFSWAFGLGYISNSGLGIDARYNLGMSNIAKINGVPHDIKNRVWQFGLFYQFLK